MMLYSNALKNGVLVLAAVVLTGCSGSAPVVISNSASPPQGPAAPTASSTQGELRLKAPDGWTSERPSSSMRVSQYQLPAAEGDAEAASLVVYYFGPGQGGSTNANIERWIGQMQPPGGASSKDSAATETQTVNGLKVTLLDVSGTYTGGDMAGSSGQAKPNFRMRAAVIDTPKGAYFIKLVGPKKTIDRWDQGFREFIKSAEFKG
jgi:hypothetical protein